MFFSIPPYTSGVQKSETTFPLKWKSGLRLGVCAEFDTRRLFSHSSNKMDISGGLIRDKLDKYMKDKTGNQVYWCCFCEYCLQRLLRKD